MIRRYLECDCGNKDDDDVPSLDVALPPCSAECGRTMRMVAAASHTAIALLQENERAASARYCGCDPGAGWVCERHRKERP